MPFALLPNAAAAAAGQARLLVRGASPQLMTTPDDDFLTMNAWLTPTPSATIGAPANEVGFPEEIAELFGYELLRPETTVDAAGAQVGLFTHGITHDALDRLWRRAVQDGLDTTPCTTLGAALARVYMITAS